KSALEKVGLFHEDMTIVADFDMWVRLARYYDTGFIREPLVQLRDHKNQLSRNRNYFIRRPIEDMHVFNYLVSYVPEDIKKEGLLNLRKYKFVYYYTLMVKAVLRGKLSTAFAFFKELYAFGNFGALTISFLRSKFSDVKKPDFIDDPEP
ncbi:MAG TPA: hypothetical protein VK498_09785, partial [Ferruginibacter sp.]|nr:hypothetical protein [Ferruginibacter sp.]